MAISAATVMRLRSRLDSWGRSQTSPYTTFSVISISLGATVRTSSRADVAVRGVLTAWLLSADEGLYASIRPHTAQGGPGADHGHRTDLRSLCAEVRRARHDQVPVLLPGGLARQADAALLRVADPGGPVSGPGRHRLPRGRRPRAPHPRLRQPGHGRRAHRREADRHPGLAHQPPALRPLGRAQPVPQGRVLDPEGRGRVLDG